MTPPLQSLAKKVGIMFGKLFGAKNNARQNTNIKPSKSVQLDNSQQVHFLALFSKPYDSNKRFSDQHREIWEEKLGVPVESVISAFVEIGLLRDTTLPEKLDAKFTLKELKKIAAKNNLKVSGRKAEVLKRVAHNLPDQFESEFYGQSILICSDKAQAAVSEHKAAQKSATAQAHRSTLLLLKERKLAEACSLVCEFELAQFFQRGMGVDWNSYGERLLPEVKLIFEATPKFHENRFGEVSEEVRLFSAMVVLWGTEQFGQTLNQLFAGKKKEEVVLAARMLSFYTAHKINLEQARSSKAKRKARILVTLDQNTTCSACKKDSDQEYSLERVPELPHPDCQCAIGCRCGAIFVRTGGLFSE